jgi:hypothetical protein
MNIVYPWIKCSEEASNQQKDRAKMPSYIKAPNYKL